MQLVFVFFYEKVTPSFLVRITIDLFFFFFFFFLCCVLSGVRCAVCGVQCAVSSSATRRSGNSQKFPFRNSEFRIIRYTPILRKQNKMSENEHESKVEMVISNVPKPVFTSAFLTFYSAEVI